jgi:hypothetical protein
MLPKRQTGEPMAAPSIPVVCVAPASMFAPSSRVRGLGLAHSPKDEGEKGDNASPASNLNDGLHHEFSPKGSIHCHSLRFHDL